MKPAFRSAALVLSAVFCGAGAFGLATNVVTPAPATPVREPDAAASIAASQAATRPLRVAANQQTYRDGSYTGPLEDAYYGLLNVRVDIQGGRIVDIQVLRYPSDNRTSRTINSRALPYLKSEVIQAQSVFVDMVSGATLSSDAFLRSAYMALRQARG